MHNSASNIGERFRKFLGLLIGRLLVLRDLAIKSILKIFSALFALLVTRLAEQSPQNINCGRVVVSKLLHTTDKLLWSEVIEHIWVSTVLAVPLGILLEPLRAVIETATVAAFLCPTDLVLAVIALLVCAYHVTWDVNDTISTIDGFHFRFPCLVVALLARVLVIAISAFVNEAPHAIITIALLASCVTRALKKLTDPVGFIQATRLVPVTPGAVH